MADRVINQQAVDAAVAAMATSLIKRKFGRAPSKPLEAISDIHKARFAAEAREVITAYLEAASDDELAEVLRERGATVTLRSG